MGGALVLDFLWTFIVDERNCLLRISFFGYVYLLWDMFQLVGDLVHTW